MEEFAIKSLDKNTLFIKKSLSTTQTGNGNSMQAHNWHTK